MFTHDDNNDNDEMISTANTNTERQTEEL